MRPGDVALFRPDGFFGYVICFVTRSRYCHVRLIVDADGSTVEAEYTGARRGRVEDGDLIVSPPLADVQRAKIEAVAAPLVGIPYAWADIFALGIAQLGIRLPFLRKMISRPDRLFCSQLVDQVWRAVGYQAFDDGRLPQNVSPGDIADIAFRAGWAAKVQEGAKP